MAGVKIEKLTKRFADGTLAVREVSLEVADGQIMVLVGPSGCGKTTTLRIVAGLEAATSGSVYIGERRVDRVDPSRRDVAMVFQNYALYPHMTVRDNMGFPLKLAGVRKDERSRRVEDVARMLGLQGYLDRRPRQLSGGQRQRVAMGRAIVRAPQVFLMDEPLSNLDAKVRVRMRADLLQLQQELAVTTIFVTHDQVEAMTLGDRVAVMRGGVVEQIGEPQAIYDSPRNVFVAGFIGSPPMNLVEGRLERQGDEYVVCAGTSRILVDEWEMKRHPALAEYAGGQVILGARPEALTLATNGLGGRAISGSIAVVETLGADTLVHFELEGSVPLPPRLGELAHNVEDPVEGEDLEVQHGGQIFVARVLGSCPLRPGSQISWALEPRAMCFFDHRTGESLAEEAPRAREGGGYARAMAELDPAERLSDSDGDR